MQEKLGIGIVGYGKVAIGTHRKWILAHPEAKLVAVCDTSEERRNAAASENPDAEVFEDYGRFLDHSGVALVIVTTPPNSHHELTIRAVRSGKHVFVDKPFAMTAAEADEMLAEGSKYGVVVHCHQSRRYDGEYQSIIDVVRSGKIGSIVHVRRVWSQYGEGWATWGIEGFNPTWRIQRSYGGGMVYDYAPHCGDQILRLVDKPLRHVFADARSIKFSREVDDHFTCSLRFDDGATAYLEASNMARIPAPHWYVMGTEGCITADTVNGPIRVINGSSGEPETVEPVDRKQQLYDNVVAACRGTAEPNVRADELRASMKLIDAIFFSARSGSAVEL